MTDKHQTDTEEPMSDNSPRGNDIRFLKEKPRKGHGPLVFALLLLVAGIVYALFARSAFVPAGPVGQEVSAEQARGMLIDRPWIDKIPEKEMDKFNVYFFSSEQDAALNDQAQSVYRHLFEIFFYRAGPRELQYQFPHDRRRGKTAYVIERLPKPDKDIDMKLTLSADPQSNNQSKVYFSSTKWSSLDRNTWPAALRRLPEAPQELDWK